MDVKEWAKFQELLLRSQLKVIREYLKDDEEYIRCHNENPEPLVWTKRAEDIVEKVAPCKAVIETLH